MDKKIIEQCEAIAKQWRGKLTIDEAVEKLMDGIDPNKRLRAKLKGDEKR